MFTISILEIFLDLDVKEDDPDIRLEGALTRLGVWPWLAVDPIEYALSLASISKLVINFLSEEHDDSAMTATGILSSWSYSVLILMSNKFPDRENVHGNMADL